MLQITLLGNVGSDAEVKQVGERYVLNFSMAHTESWTDRAGVKQQKTTWFKIAKWYDRAPGIAPYIKKGAQIWISARSISIDAYVKNDGTANGSLVLNPDDIRLAGGSQTGSGQAANNNASDSATGSGYGTSQPEPIKSGLEMMPGNFDDDLPF